MPLAVPGRACPAIGSVGLKRIDHPAVAVVGLFAIMASGVAGGPQGGYNEDGHHSCADDFAGGHAAASYGLAGRGSNGRTGQGEVRVKRRADSNAK